MSTLLTAGKSLSSVIRPEFLLLLGIAALGLLTARVLTVNPLLAGLLILGIGVVAVTIRHPQPALVLIFPLLLVEGALRKWIVPGIQEYIYLAKDGLLLTVLLAWLLRAAEQRPQETGRPIPGLVKVTLSLVACYFVLQILNPQLPNIAFLIFGLRTYLLPLALIFLIPQLLSAETALKMHKGLVYSLVPLCGLAVLQSQLGADHPLNQYAWGDLYVASYGKMGSELVRVTSTFSYITGFSAYLTVAGFSIMTIASYYRRIAPGWIMVFALLAVVCSILTGSRRTVGYMAIGLPISALPLLPQFNSRKLFQGTLLLVPLLGLLLNFFSEPIEQFRYRSNRLNDLQARMFGTGTAVRLAIEAGGVFGLGPSTTHASRESLLRITKSWAKYPGFIERELSKVFAELGIIGGFFWYLFRAALVLMMFQWFYHARERQKLNLQVALIAPVLFSLLTFSTTLVMDSTLYYLFCGWVGILRLYPDTLDADPLSASSAKRLPGLPKGGVVRS